VYFHPDLHQATPGELSPRGRELAVTDAKLDKQVSLERLPIRFSHDSRKVLRPSAK
jgi:hypothetical protein